MPGTKPGICHRKNIIGWFCTDYDYTPSELTICTVYWRISSESEKSTLLHVVSFPLPSRIAH